MRKRAREETTPVTQIYDQALHSIDDYLEPVKHLTGLYF